MTAVAWERKEQLQKEIEEIKIAIKALENNPLCEFSRESKKEVLDTDTLMYALMMTENINNMQYTNVELTNLEEDLFEYEADATTGPVEYHLQFKLKFTSEGTKPSISDLKITMYNDFMQTELKSWQNKCVRENSLQTFQRGIVSYSKLFIIREKIFVFLTENVSEYFLLERCVEEGKYIISAVNKETDIQYFWCTWELSWNSVTSSMMNFFKLHANNRGYPTSRNHTYYVYMANSICIEYIPTFVFACGILSRNEIAFNMKGSNRNNSSFYVGHLVYVSGPVKVCFLHILTRFLVRFSEENKDLFAELTNSASNLTSERVEEIWKTLAENVIEAIQES